VIVMDFHEAFSLFSFLKSLEEKIMALLARVTQLIEYFTLERENLLTENATLKEQLATALANDAADAEAIASAQGAAAEAKASLEAAQGQNAELQSAISADVAEDEQIEALISSVLPQEPAPEP
jgi:regulator of replication initiation timing